MTRNAAGRGLIMLVALFVTTAGACEQDLDGGTSVTFPEQPIGSAPDADAPYVDRDHWHAPYGIWVCDRFVPSLTDRSDALGIHTHDDGLIHIHPSSEESAGAKATLGLFADEVGLGLDDGSFTLPSGQTYAEGDDCNGSPGRVWLIEWPDPTDPQTHRTRDGGLRDVRLADGAAYTVAFLGPTTDPRSLLPPSTASLSR